MALFGPDGSRWQAGIKLGQADWDAIGFLIWRASSTYIDPTFAWARQQAVAHRKPFLAYHALYGPQIRRLETQADTFHQAVEPGMRCMIDWEGWDGGTQGCTFDQVLQFRDLLAERGHEATVIYTFGAFWQQQGRPTLAGHGFDLGMARYGAQDPIGEYEIEGRYSDMVAAGNAVWNKDYGGLHPVLWQFGSRIRWGDRFMDMNAYSGRVQDLDQWFVMPPGAVPTPTPPTPAPPTDEDDSMTEDQERKLDALAQAVQDSFTLIQQFHEKVDALAREQSVQDSFVVLSALHPKVDDIGRRLSELT